ncbi:glycosyltransferase family 4 protein [Chryseobacterium sp. Y16C]|uniref:glycosyltransferase family 4 protein n=1 Tax=Chryseobacterium sp. Y16C TaxID=2920939 RepID=UPI001F0C5B30|nr:glycosyltransferase family 4 protein [Chryseobacterium sp. Y16C]UMQ43805.1 glycosyltransferase family 4 protein [Chryseobacterium sp. Y16C]
MKKKSAKKVLHVITISFVIKHFFGNQFKYLKNKTGNKYYLACTPSKELVSWQDDFDYHAIPIEITRSISPFRDIIAIYKLIRFIKKEKIDVVVAHTPKGGLVGMISAALCRVPERIYFRHGIAYETSKAFKRNLLKNIERISGYLATKVVNVSKGVEKFAVQDRLNQKNKNLILKKGTCNGIDARERFNPGKYSEKDVNQLRNTLNIAAGDFVIGYVGRLVHDKGIDELLEAWQKLKQYANMKLLLVGPFEDKDSVNDLTKQRILSDSNVIYTDYVPDSAIYFRLMNIFVLATYREGFPTVSLEASSMELPVIITRATGCEEAIIENETGIFINNSSKDIEVTIKKYYNEYDLCKTHGEKGRQFVLEFFEQSIIWNTINKELEY